MYAYVCIYIYIYKRHPSSGPTGAGGARRPAMRGPAPSRFIYLINYVIYIYIYIYMYIHIIYIYIYIYQVVVLVNQEICICANLGDSMACPGRSPEPGG